MAALLRRLIGITVLSLLALAPRVAVADSVDRLIKLLRTDESYKVRLAAALRLGKLRSRRAVPALIAALRDSEYTVRGIAAAALGKIGDTRAGGPLRAMLARESNSFAKRMAQKALSSLGSSGPGCATPSPGAKYFLLLGKIANKSGKGGRQLADRLGRALLRHFRSVRGVTVCSMGSKPSGSLLRKHRMRAFVLDGSILQLTTSRSGSQVQISCSIKVSLATYPGNSLKAFYSGGASMAVGARELTPSSSSSLFGELIAGAAAGAKQQIANSYLSRQ
ncbi:MAG: HEAT repeat domain-containing protein [Myxococcales bacterium]|nr:HEAT repeat domain-containing protein [Myxococcales bacterium]